MKIYDFTNLYPYVPHRNLWLDAAIQATASHINTGINWLMNKDTNKANERINQQQIEYAREAFEKEKDYNNWLLGNQRQMQMNDAKSAGVNPAFAQGSNLGGASISPKQEVPNQIPMNYNFDASGISAGISNAMQYLLQKKQVDASAKNLEADTYKKMAETDRQLIENEWLPRLMEGEWRIQTSTLAVNGSIKFKNDEEARLFSQQVLESSKRMDQIDENIKLLQVEVENMKVDTRIKTIEEFWKSDQCQAEIDNLRSSAALSRQQAQDIIATQAARIMLLDTQATTEMYKALNIEQDTENMRETHRLLGLEGDQREFNLKSDKKYRNKERALGLINGATQAAENTTSAISNLLPWKLGKNTPLPSPSGTNGYGGYRMNSTSVPKDKSYIFK